MPAQRKDQMVTRAQQKARAARVDAKARKACVDAVWIRADGRCESCGADVWRNTSLVLRMGHVHEKRARSLGGDPHDPNGCELLCVQCHMPNGAHRRSERASV